MWCPGAFVASSALNAFVALLLWTQDPGNDSIWRLSGVVLGLHTLGLLQSIFPSALSAYIQWAASAPLLCWLLGQLLGTLPPNSSTLSSQRLFRCAALEALLAVAGLAVTLLAADLPLVRAGAGVVSITVLSLELLPYMAPYLPAYLVPSFLAASPTTPPAAAVGPSATWSAATGGSWARPAPLTPRSSQRGLSGLGGGGLGFAGSGTSQTLPLPMEVLMCGMAIGKMLQAISAAAVGSFARGSGYQLLMTRPGVFTSTLWVFSTSVAVYGLPLAVCMYYGLVRYAASMLVARRSVLRRVSSLGLAPWSAEDQQQPQQQQQQQGRGSAAGGSLLSSFRRASPFGAGGGADSDSDSGLQITTARLLEIGDLYRITEGSDHSLSYSTSGDEGWRSDLALTQLLYMARTTFRGANAGTGRSSTDESRTPESGAAAGSGSAGAQVGPVSHHGGSGASGGAGLGAALRSWSPPRVPSVPVACQTDPVHRGGQELGVQCELEPSVVVKEVLEVVKEVRVEVPVPAPAAGGGGGGNDPALMSLILALREHSSDIAHDMKNPLNGVLALSQNVLQGTFGDLPQAAGDQLGVVRACAYHLLNMINQLRDCLRMLHGGEPDGNCGRVQLANAIEEVLKRMSPMVGSRLTIRAEHDPALIVYADDGRLYQTVHTVLANAFKYTRKGGVTIETAAAADKSTVTLRVVDTGTGFTPDQLEKFNSPLTGSPEEQLGLGLTMVKRTMAFFGGLLRLGNKTGGGGGWVELTFRTKEEVPALGAGLPPPPQQQAVAAPAAPVAAAPPALPQVPAAPASAPAAAAPAAVAPSAPAPPPAQPAPSGRKVRKSVFGSDRSAMEERLAMASSSNDTAPRGSARREGAAGGGGVARSGLDRDDPLASRGDEPVRVLIVDDDPINLTILEDLLRAEGYDVLTAASGTEALETYLTSDPQPKLVLLDVTLPDLSGHEVCLKMRSLTPGVPPPIIMISGKASTKDVIKGLQAGACDYITKPFQPQEVMARVETQLRLFMGEVAQLQEAAERNMALLRQILPPHILASLKGGTRVLAEKFSDVVVLCVDVVGFSSLAAAADTADCILTLNRLFSTFDALTDKMGVHKMDCHTDSYVAALGHMPQDRHLSNVMQVKVILDLAREMLAAVDTLPYPDTLGKMQIRVGVHVGAVYGGVIGVKYPRYSLFGMTLRLAQGLQATALPNTIHVTEVVHNRVRIAGGETFTPYTTSQVQGLGIIRTYLAGPSSEAAPGGFASAPGMLDFTQLENAVVVDYLRTATVSAHGITVLNCLLGAGGGSAPVHSSGIGSGLNTFSAVTVAAVGNTGGSSGAAMLGRGGLGAPKPALATVTPPLAKAVMPATGGVGGLGEGGAAAAASASLKIIPVVSGRSLAAEEAEAGVIGGASSVGSGDRRESDGASGFAITLSQVAHGPVEHHGQEHCSMAGMAVSGDAGSVSVDSLQGAALINQAAPGPGAAAGVTSTSSASGTGVAVGSTHVNAVPQYGITGFSVSGSSAAAAAAPAATAGGAGSGAGGAGSGAAAAAAASRRQNSDASLVQDLSPGPTASAFTRLQRMHAPQTLAALGSGVASPRHTNSGAAGPTSCSGSRGPSRNTSFRLGGGASPLAASVMQQQLLTSLQQQQQQQLPQLPHQLAALQVSQQLAATPGASGAANTDTNTNTISTDELSFTGDVDAGADVASGCLSASEPLLKVQGFGAGAGDAGGDPGAVAAGLYGSAGRTSGLSSAAIRRIHMPLKAASVGAIPGPAAAAGGAGVAGIGIGTVSTGSGPGSLAGSVGPMSTAGSIGSPQQFFSSSAYPRAEFAAAGGGGSFGASAANISATSSPYAGLSNETRARLARLRTASQPDLHDAIAGVGGGAASAANMGSFTASDPLLAGGAQVLVVDALQVSSGAHPQLPHVHQSTAPAYRQSSLGNPMGTGTARSNPGGVTGGASPQAQAAALRRAPSKRPSTVGELLDSLGLGHYSRSISGALGGGLNELAGLDDGGLRKMGLVSARSRQLVVDELRRWGYQK